MKARRIISSTGTYGCGAVLHRHNDYYEVIRCLKAQVYQQTEKYLTWHKAADEANAAIKELHIRLDRELMARAHRDYQEAVYAHRPE